MSRKSIFKSVLALAGVAMLTTGTFANYLIIEDFDDQNTTAEAWGNAFIGGTDPITSPGLGLAIRTREVFPIGFADLESEFPIMGGSGVFQLGESGPDDGMQPFSNVAPSDRTTTTSATAADTYQFTGFNMIRATSFDSTPYKYFRFTAWNDSPPATYQNIGDSGIVVMFGDSLMNNSTGPFDPTGSDVAPITLSTTPDSYLIAINETVPTEFKVEPVFNRMFSTTNANPFGITQISIGYRRADSPLSGTNNLGTRWFLDDLTFYETEPDILTSGPLVATLNENPSDSTIFDVVLGAEPFAPVTVNFTPDLAGITLNPTSFTFLPTGATPTGPNEAEWDQTQSITVTAVDNGTFEADPVISISFSQVTTDLYYDSIPVAPLSVQVINDDPPSNVKDWKVIND